MSSIFYRFDMFSSILKALSCTFGLLSIRCRGWMRFSKVETIIALSMASLRLLLCPDTTALVVKPGFSSSINSILQSENAHQAPTDDWESLQFLEFRGRVSGETWLLRKPLLQPATRGRVYQMQQPKWVLGKVGMSPAKTLRTPPPHTHTHTRHAQANACAIPVLYFASGLLEYYSLVVVKCT